MGAFLFTAVLAATVSAVPGATAGAAQWSSRCCDAPFRREACDYDPVLSTINAEIPILVPPPRVAPAIPTTCCASEAGCARVLADARASDLEWACAAQHLVALGPSIAPRMMKAIKDPDTGARARAAGVLGRLHERGADVEAALLRSLERGARLLADENWGDRTWRRAVSREVRSWFLVPRAASERVWDLASVVQGGQDGGASDQVLEILAYLRAVRVAAPPRDLSPATSPIDPGALDPHARLACDLLVALDWAGTLGIKGHRPIRDRRFLAEALHFIDDDERPVRWAARKLAASLAEKTELPLLARLVHEQEDGGALLRLHKLGPAAAAAAPDVREVLGHGNWDDRGLAADVLAKMGDRAAVPALVRALSAPDFRLARHAARALDKLDPTGAAVTEQLAALAWQHWATSTREAAATALAHRGICIDERDVVPVHTPPRQGAHQAYEVRWLGRALRVPTVHVQRSAQVNADPPAGGRSTGEAITARLDLGDRLLLGTFQWKPDDRMEPSRSLVVVDKKTGDRSVLLPHVYVSAFVTTPRGHHVLEQRGGHVGEHHCQLARLRTDDLVLEPVAELPLSWIGGVLVEESGAIVVVGGDSGLTLPIEGEGGTVMMGDNPQILHGAALTAFRVADSGQIQRLPARYVPD